MFKPIDGQKIPDWTLSYFRQRNKNRVHSLVLKELKKSKLSQAEIARRLNKRPDVICRLFGAPGNWTLDTVSDLLFAISGVEAAYAVADPLEAAPRNFQSPDWVRPSPQSSTGRIGNTLNQSQLKNPIVVSSSVNVNSEFRKVELTGS